MTYNPKAMRNKKLVILVLLFLLVLSFAGCADKKAGLSIKPEIYEYSPMMSSTPGIPLIAQFTRDLKNKNYKYHWVAEQGTFLKWNDKGQGMGSIAVLGNDIKTNVHKVYWTVDYDDEIKVASFKVHLTIEELDTGKVMYEASIQIDQQKEGYFTIKE